jgi:hypothetical protein
MGRYLRKWMGIRTTYPQDPDLVLAKLLNWTPGPMNGPATWPYPEPCNIIAAAAFENKIPQEAIASEAFIFKDKKTNLWVQAVGTKLLKWDDVAAWHDLQTSLGAVAVWYFNQAWPPRRQPKFIDQATEVKPTDIISNIHLLNNMGKFKINDIDLTKLYPEKFAGLSDIEIVIAQQDVKDYRRLKLPQEKKLPGQRSGYSKCVIAPHGLFVSATLAGAAINKSSAWVSVRASKGIEGYQYISRSEYLRLTGLNTHEQKSVTE